MNSFSGNSYNSENLLIQTLLDRLQIRPPAEASSGRERSHPILSQSLEDLLLLLSDEEDDDCDEYSGSKRNSRSQLSKEEAKLEKEIIKIILSGTTDSLCSNSGKAITVGEHHVCVQSHEEKGSDYRVWEWHGHIMLFDEENGYTPEYIYGNYFERLLGKVKRSEQDSNNIDCKEEVNDNKEEEVVRNLGLRELIGLGDSSGARILHRNITPSSTRFG